MCEAWIGFAGSILGGAITFIGVIATIKYYKRQEVNKDDKEKKYMASILFWNLIDYKAQIDVTYECLIEDKYPIEDIPFIKYYSNSDYQHLIMTLPHLVDIIEIKEAAALIGFYRRIEDIYKDSQNDKDAALHRVMELHQEDCQSVKMVNITEILDKIRTYIGME